MDGWMDISDRCIFMVAANKAFLQPIGYPDYKEKQTAAQRNTFNYKTLTFIVAYLITDPQQSI